MAYQVKVNLFMIHNAYVLIQLKLEKCEDEEEKNDLLEKKKLLLAKQVLLEEIMRKCGYYREIDDIAFLARAAADYQIETGSNSKYIENINLI